MFISTSSSSINNHLIKRRSTRHLISKTMNVTDNNNITSTTNRIRLFDIANSYNAMKYLSTLTKTQIKVLITVVIIISFIMLIIAIVRFKNACRSQHKDNLQTEIMRNRASQFNEPSSRRGSVGYYTRKYSRTPSIRLDDQINNSLPTKRLSIPACDPSSKSTAVIALSPLPVDTTDVVHHHHHVISSCDTSNIPKKQISIASTSSINIKPLIYKSSYASSIARTNQYILPLHSLTILSIHNQSRRLILCTIPPHILCRPTKVRYIFVIHVHDQRHRYPSGTARNNIKLSSPTLRKLCLPCITTRQRYSRNHLNKKQTQKSNQRRLITGITRENNVPESIQQFEVVPRTYNTISTNPVTFNSNHSKRNNDNHSHEQHQHCEISFQNEKNREEKHNETSVVKIETKPTSSEVLESELLLSSLTANELTRLHDDDDVCDDRTPLLKSELASNIKDSSNHTTRKYSFNALLPLIRPSNSHPLCSSLTSTNANGGNCSNGDGVDIKPRHRASLSSALRRSSYAKQSNTFCSTVDSTTHTASAISPPTRTFDSDHSEQTSISSNNQQATSYNKDFMQKIERFRFIDDSASSTTTVTSPVESIEQVNTRSSAFEDFIHAGYHNHNYDDNVNDNDDVNSLIDRLNSTLLTNGSYSDLNILNNMSSTKPILCSKTIQPPTTLSGCQQMKSYQSTPINIPHSVTSLPLSKQRNQSDTNGYSRSMDFQAISNKRDRIRPITIIGTFNEPSSSSSTATLTSVRSSTSLEFDDNTKPSGVLVDDDFLPMSSPVDEHFWDININHHNGFNNNKCFPDVGSSPDIEVKHFDLQQFNTLSETSCDEDDDDNDDDDASIKSINLAEKFSIHEYKINESQNLIVLTKSPLPVEKVLNDQIIDKAPSNPPSVDATEQIETTEEFLLEKFKIPSDFLCDNNSSKNQAEQTVSEEDDTQESSANELSEGDESADNGEIDLVQEFELSQKEKQNQTNNIWTTNDRNIFILQKDDLFSALVATPTIVSRTPPASIMKITNNKTSDQIDEQQQQQQQTLRPKVRFNLDPQYEREREWNKVNKLLGNSVEWTDEFEV